MGAKVWEKTRCRPRTIFIDQLMDDTGHKKEELGRAIDEGNGWKEVVRSVLLRTIC